jgi:hypothetical protein
MKRYSILLAALLALSSCREGFLELSPISQPNVNDFYKTPNDLLNAVNAAYASLQTGSLYAGRDLQDLAEYRADNAFDNDPSANSGLRYNIDRFQAGSENTVIENVWRRLYETIYRCNVLLDNADAVAMDETLKNRYKAEARFIRALCYSHLVQLWGPVPVVLKAESSEESRNHVRNSVAEVYQAIEADLQFAAQNLPPTYSAAETGRATRGAAQGLLGKMYLTQKKYAEAVSTLADLVSSGTFSLMPTPAQVFGPTNEYNKEILFAVRFTASNNAEAHGLYFSSAIGDFIEASFRGLYDSADARKALIELKKPAGTQNQTPVKYFEELSANGQVGTDFPVLRYADVLLMLAEALNEVSYQASGDAFAHLNAVRTRAGLPAYTAAQLASQEAFRDAVLLERRLELPLELHRWYDLLRTGRAKAAMQAVGLTIQDFQLLFPIPNSQVLIYNNPSGFPQNAGY